MKIKTTLTIINTVRNIYFNLQPYNLNQPVKDYHNPFINLSTLMKLKLKRSIKNKRSKPKEMSGRIHCLVIEANAFGNQFSIFVNFREIEILAYNYFQ